MASSLRELIVRISADSSVYQREMSRASRMGTDYYRTMEGGARRQDLALQRNQTNLRALNAQMVEIRQTALRMTGVLAGAFAAGRLIETADAYGQMASRIRLAIDSERDYAQVQERLQQISRITYKSLMDNSELFVNSVGPLRELGFATEEVLDLTEALSAGLVISGANAQRTTSLIDQFGKAMVAGKLQGDSFNAVIQNAPRLQQALADGLGVSTRKLQEMATAGELTADVVMGALQRSLGDLRQELDEMPTSVEDATQVLKDSFMAYIGQANDAHGTTAVLAGGIELLADNIDNVVAVAGVFAAMGLGRYMGGLAVSASAAAIEFAKNAQAQIAYASAQQQAVASTLQQASAERANALAAQRSLGAQLRLAQTESDRHRIRTQLSANSLLLADASRRETANANALAAANTRLAAATSLSNRAKQAALALLPGPAGLITLAAGAAASFLLFRDRTDEAAAALISIEQPMDTLIEQFRSLAVEQQRAALIQWGDKQAEEAEKARAALGQIRREAANFGGARIFGGRNEEQYAAYREFLNQLRLVEEGARSLDDVLNEAQGNLGVPDNVMREWRLLASLYAEGRINAEEYAKRTDQLRGEMEAAADASNRLGGSVNGNAPSEQTLQAWQRYNDQLREQIANLRDPSALGQANRWLDAQGVESPIMRGVTLSLVAQAERERMNAEARKKAADAAREAAREGQRNAERILQAYQQQAETLQRQIALHGDASREAALRYDLEQGSLRDLSAAQGAHLLQLEQELATREQLAKKAIEAQELLRFEMTERARLAARQQDMEIDIIAVGRSDQAVAVMREIATVRQRYADEMRELHQRQEDDSTKISESAFEERRELLQQLMDEEVSLVEQAALRKRAAEEDWRNGAARGLEQYLDQARNVAGQYENATVSALQNMEGALANFVTKGKLGFASLADSIINDLVRIAIRQAALGIFGSFGGSSPIVGGFMSQIFAEGGYTGPGGKYEPAGIVHRGEVVWSQEDVTRAGGLSVVESLRKGFSGYADGGVVGGRVNTPSMPNASGRGGVTINMIEDRNRAGQSQERTDPDGSRTIDVMVANIMADGKMHKALSAKYGLSTRANN